ncbi:MAG: PKD domain-containing protein [Bacteroidales bacterium]|nr:PKD domain-containing protein [Bacteroidales bacterium]MCF8402723.1 PKD domain-containing protein [Bacteroidales bacterium]
MKTFTYYLSLLLITFFVIQLNAQEATQKQKATLIVTSETMIEIPSIASQLADGSFKPANNIIKEFNPKQWGKNTAVDGKGLPRGNDPLWEKQAQATKSPGKAPILTFDAATSGSTPTDPTAAVGPQHFVNAWNSSFRIWDKAGNPLTPAAALGTILNGNAGDPIVFYDRYADRFIITEFYSNGFGMAVCQGPDPVNDGWYLYLFNTNVFPDYPKFSVWSDGYYITANKNSSTAGTSEVVFATERDKMLVGNTSALMIGFPLTNIVTSGFYSPLGFNCNGPEMPPPGNAPIVYMQDDVWSGVSTDHLKIWNINVNWTTPGNSTISSPQILNTTPFDGLFDGGSFSNLPQPSGGDIDALQATIMYMAQYRRFSGYNSVVFNFVVDLNGADNYAGIRWYELRQTSAGGNWSIYQEGTYSQPNGHSAFSGNMCMDASGNIALAYTIVSSTQVPSLRYTGRFASDPLGAMTMTEEVIGNGTQSDPSTRYGDYSQMTIDPVDDATFWSIGEYFTGGTRVNRVGVIQFAPPVLTADFTASPTSVCTGGMVSFTDASLGSPTSWNWSFPGGTPSFYSGPNPPAISYSSVGSYSVTLTVGDGIDTDIETKTNYITVAGVIADFSGTPESVVKGNTVTFTDLSDCSPTSWSWSFPGGNPSSFSGQNPPPILYDTEGTYDVSLTVSNGSGNNTKTIPGYITVIAPEFNIQNGTVTTCEGNFYDSGGSSGAYTNNENFVMTFYASTSGAQLEFLFTQFNVEYQSSCSYDYLNIYDGENTSAPLIGQYCGTNSPGLVTSSNAAGALTFQWHSDVSVTGTGWTAAINCTTNPPSADFVASNTSPSPGANVVFTDLSIGGPTSWNWTIVPNTYTFVNGTNANSQNPIVQFSDFGAYSVTLEVTNAYGNDIITKVNYINVISCTYCSAGGSTGDEEWISNVTFNTINNSSAAATGYTNYTSISTDVSPGSSYNLSISCNSIGSWVENYWVFFDWNQDCDFDDPGEGFDLGQTTGPGTLTTNITIPSDAVTGVCRMRIFLKYSSDPASGCEAFSFGEVEDYTLNVLGSDITISLKVLLEGPFNGSSMNPDLTNILPLDQPYNTSPWNYNGSESVAGPAVDYVDWILVELRDALSAAQANSGTILAQQAAFVNSNGEVVATDGNPILTFAETVSNNLFVVVHHRNHLSVLSANPLTQTGGIYTYDFTTAAGQAYGGASGHKEVAPGVWAMFAADGNSDGMVNALDESPLWENEAGNSGFLNSDFNLDGESNNIDKDDYLVPNIGEGTQVPN